MKHTKEEILNALHVIKDTCYESYEVVDGISSCYKCPFSDCDGHCILGEQSPLSWDIKNDEPWKGDIIWDNLHKKNLKINFIEVSRWGEKIIDGWLEGDIMSLVYLFEPNRFYRKEIKDVD